MKSFSKAKTRLNLPQIQKEDLCLKMFDEVLRTISNCKSIDIAPLKFDPIHQLMSKMDKVSVE